jgi:hypothetical protein
MQIVTPPAGTAGDTIRTSPVAGASISVIQSSIEGFAMGTTVAHATTDADGSFTVPNLTAGAYRLSVTPPAGSGLSAAVYDFVAQQATVSVTIQLPFVR